MGYGTKKETPEIKTLNQIERLFLSIIETRSSWGKNQIQQAWKDARIKFMENQALVSNFTSDPQERESKQEERPLRYYKSGDILDFGKYKGMVIDKVDREYIRWCLDNVDWFRLSSELEPLF